MIAHMPADTWVYIHVAADGALLYIGKTVTPRYRIRAHAKSASWWPLAAEVDHFGPFTEDEALRIEAALLATHQPPFNKFGTDRAAEVYARRGATNRRRGEMAVPA